MSNDSKPLVERIHNELTKVPEAVEHPGYDSDDGPLTESQIADLRQLSASMLPSGVVVLRCSLF